jgi:hypothetical protein
MRSQRVQLSLHPLALLHRQLTAACSKHDGRSFMANFQRGSFITDSHHDTGYKTWQTDY